MMDWIKKQGIGFYATAVVFVLTIVSMIIYCANATTEYYSDLNGGLLALAIIALLCMAAALIIPQLEIGENKYAKILVDVLRIAAACLLVCFVFTFLNGRVESFGYIFGSNLELGNEAAAAAANQAIVCAVLFLVAWIISLPAAFFSMTRKA